MAICRFFQQGYCKFGGRAPNRNLSLVAIAAFTASSHTVASTRRHLALRL